MKKWPFCNHKSETKKETMDDTLAKFSSTKINKPDYRIVFKE
jgi:hypothetical protein